MNGTRNGILAALVSIGFAISPLVSWSDDFVRRTGQHIRLTTDIESPEQVDDLIKSFDAAVPQWAAFWGLPAGTLDAWKVDAYVIRDKPAFERAGLIPRSVPDFPFGYALGDQIWVVAQKSEYYTRHLLLHEGVHALAFHQFGGAGPSWFMEGTAELLSVHTGSGEQTKINQVPADNDSVPYWGRFKLMRQRRDAAEIPALETVMGYPRDLNSDVESYGWSWAATMLLYNYPQYREAFQRAARNGIERAQEFNQNIRQDLAEDWPVVSARWRLMCHDLDYGFDWSREQAKLSMEDATWDGSPLKIEIAADQGWQSIGVRFEAGMTLKVLPQGRCELAAKPKPWISEPPGITFRYHRGRPLGQLLACIVPNAPDNAKTLPPLKVAPITQGSTIPIKENCWFLLRVNDAPGELGDNQGGYTIKIQ